MGVTCYRVFCIARYLKYYFLDNLGMAYKKYIKRGNRKFGPYYYESYRDKDGNVRKRYVGRTLEKKRVAPTNFKLILLIFLVISIALIIFLFYNLQITGKASLDMREYYILGDNIFGNLQLSLKEGELIPSNTIVKINMAGETSEFLLSDLIVSNDNGIFYIENFELSGEGEGYGFPGTRTSYPEVFFKLRVFEVGKNITEEVEAGEAEGGMESIISQESQPLPVSENITNQTQETQPTEGTLTEVNQTEEIQPAPIPEPTPTPQPAEQASQLPAEQPSQLPKQENKQEKQEAKEEKKEEKQETIPITGASVKESTKEVEGSAKKGEDFVYNLEEGETAEIKKNSVEIEKTDKKEKIDDNEISLKIENNLASVSTEYSETLEGFGKEYLGEKKQVNIDLSKLNISAQSGTLKISLVYENIILTEISKEIGVEREIIIEQNITEENITLINETAKNITLRTLNITTRQYKAVIGKPVKWIKTITLENLTQVELPKTAENITIKTGGEIADAEKSLEDSESIVEDTDKISLMTGNVISETSNNGLLTRIFRYFRLTGNVISESELEITETSSNKIVDVSGVANPGEKIVIEYETPAPLAVEETTSTGKKITVSADSELNYTDILAYSTIPEKVRVDNSQSIKLYHYVWTSLSREAENQSNNETKTPDEASVNANLINETQIIEAVNQTINETEIQENEIINETANENQINETTAINESNITGVVEDNNTSSIVPVETPAAENLTAENKTLTSAGITGNAVLDINESDVAVDNVTEIALGYWAKEEVSFNAYDLDENGLIDYVEWNVPHLSEQVYEIIYITKAEHLDENYGFIEDVYDYVKTQDDNWTEIQDGHYVRVTFEQALDKTKDITIYARAVNWANKTSECYDNKTEILTENGWKYFAELKDNEKVMTLNANTGEKELQLPTERQVYDNNGEMYNIETEEGNLSVSEEHKVYSAENQKEYPKINLINSSVVNTLTSDCLIICRSFDQIAELAESASARKSASSESEVKSMDFSKKSSYSEVLINLTNPSISFCLISNSCSDNLDLAMHSDICSSNSVFKNSGDINSILDIKKENKYELTDFGFINEKNMLVSNTSLILVINESYFNNFSLLDDAFFSNFSLISGETSLSNCSNLPFLAFLPNSTDHLINSCSSLDSSFLNNSSACFWRSINLSLTNSERLIQRSLDNLAFNSSSTANVIDAIYSSPLDFNNSHFSNSSTFSFITLRATSATFTSGNVFLKLANTSSGTEIVILGILTPSSNYVNSSKDVYLNLSVDDVNLSSFSLQKITDVYSDFNSGKDVYFLNSENKPVKVKSITKQDYSGKIYDVDVPNDIVLVKRGNSQAIWSGNSNPQTASVEVYRENGNETLAVFGNITNLNNSFDKYQIFLTSLDENESYSTFDLKSIGDVEYDYVVDPTIAENIVPNANLINVTAEGNFTHLNISTTAPYDGLVGYWNFDGDKENAQLTKHYDWTKNNYDGTGYQNVVVNSTGCIYGDCANFDGDGDYVEIPSISSMNYVTISTWIKTTQTPADNAQLINRDGGYSGSTGRVWQFRMISTGKLEFIPFNTTGANGDAVSTISINDGNWHYIVSTWDGTTVRNYVDGAADGTGLLSGTLATNQTVILLGLATPAWTGGSYFLGLLDEVMIFNTALTSTQILAIYNNQSGRFKTQGTQDIINQTYMNIPTGNDWVNVTTYTESLLGSSINLSVGYYNTSWSYTSPQVVSSGAVQTFNISSTSTNLTLNYTFYAGNSTNPFYSPIIKENIIFTAWNVDTTPPAINFTNPTPGNGTSQTGTSIYVNISSSDTNQHYVVNNFDNSLVGWWRGEGNANDEFGRYNGTLQGNANASSAGKYNSSFGLDGTGDYVQIPSISSMNYVTISTWIKTTQTPADSAQLIQRDYADGRVWQFRMTSTGKLEFIPFNTAGANGDAVSTISINDGNWHYIASTWDGTTVRNYVDGVANGTSLLSGTLATYQKVIQVGAPNGAWTGGSYFLGSLDEIIIFNRSLSAIEILALYNAGASQYYNNFTGLAVGTHTMTGYAVDTSGNKNQTDMRSVTVDITPPVVNITYPLNITYNINVSALNYTVSDSIGLSRCWYSNSSGVWNSTSVSAGINWTGLVSIEGSNIWSVYCNDTTNNINSSSVTFTKDTTYPIFSLYWDNNASLTGSGTGLFNVTLTNTNGTVFLQISNTNYTATNLTSNVYNASVSLSSGTYSYYWGSWGNGTSHLYNVSDTRSYSVNVTPQVSITAIYPTSNINVTQNTFFNVTLNVSCLTGNCGTVNVSLDPTSQETLKPNGNGNAKDKFTQNKTEIVSERTYNQKVYDLGNGKNNYKIHSAQIHYKDANAEFKDIDTTLSFDNTDKQWKQSNASYQCKIPEYSDDWFEFYNAYEGANQTIKTKPVASHIKGEYFKEADGSQGVIYKDAFGKGIDLKVYAYWEGIKKVISINKKPADISKDLTFEFELELPQGKDKVKDKEGNIWDKSSALNFKDKTIKIGDDGKESYFRNAKVWDSNKLKQPVDIELYVKGDKVYLRKTITAEILQKAVYPLYTDHPASYYAGAGDGFSGHDFAGDTWDIIHNATSAVEEDWQGTTHLATYAVVETVWGMVGNNYEISRAFFPINTSGIDDSATITSAVLYLYNAYSYNGNNDGSDFIGVVQTTQASTSELVYEDYDQCGAVHTPTEGTDIADRVDMTDMAEVGYYAFTLNATGISWIKKTDADPITMLGAREGHDILDLDIGIGGANNYVYFSTSEETGTSQDPYLDVTVSGGTSGKGLISTTPGATPFYTNATTNPLTTGSLNAGQSETIIFWVNATGTPATWLFFAFANLTTNLSIGNITGTWNVTIQDITPPVVNITYPLNTTYNINVSALNYTIIEANPSRCWYSNSSGVWNSTSQSAGTNFTNVISVEGSNTWTLYCNDTSGNENSSSVSFSKDTGAPTISQVTITPSITGLGQLINITANATDSSGISSVWVAITPSGQSQVNYTMSNSSIQIFNYSYRVWFNGTYSVIVYANDTLGILGSNSSQTFVVYNDNITVQIRTLQDSYRNNTIINITDPPEGEDMVKNLAGRLADSQIKGEENQQESDSLNNLDNSLVSSTCTDDCLFNNFSSLQMGQLYLIANAKYGESLGWLGNNSQALGMQSLNSSSGINLILSSKIDKTSENSSSVLCVLDNISSLLLRNSISKNSGAIRLNFLETNISFASLLPLINIENSSLASTTNIIYLPPLDNLYLLANASLTFLPSFNASSSVSSLSLAKDFNILNCFIFIANASLATSDQFIILNSSISLFSSSGSDKVIFVILNSSLYHIDTQNTHNSHIFKPFVLNNEPEITNVYTIPNDVAPGDKMLVSADVSDSSGIKKVTADMPFEDGVDVLNLNLVKGDKYSGTWQGVWDVHDTLEKNYTTIIRAENESGEESNKEIIWHDAGICSPATTIVSLNSSIYSATVGSTFKVNATQNGVGSGCILRIQENISGSWNQISANNVTLDCNGNSCAMAGVSSFIATLRCQATGTYDIRAYYSATVVSEVSIVTCTAASSGITYSNFSSSRETTNLSAYNLTADTNITNLVIGTNTLAGKIKFMQDVTLNDSYNLDNAIVISSTLIRVNSTLYSSLNKSAEITVRGISGLGYPKILKDGVVCSDCVISRWDKSVGELTFNVSSFSDYTWQEANQSKVMNNGTYNISFYLLMKTQHYDSGWVDEDIVINDSAAGTLRTVNTSLLLKLDAGIWNAALYNSSNLSSGDGTYRVYVALQDNAGNVLSDSEGASLSASFNFTLDNSAPSSITLNSPADDALIADTANNVTFNWTAIDAIDTSLTCNLTVDSVVEGINIAFVSESMTNYTVNDIAVGDHEWNVTCWDDALNINTSASYNFSVSDMVYPQVNITYPINGTNYNINVSALNYTIIEANPSRCWYSNSSGVWNSTSQSAGTNFTDVISVEGSNTWTVYCNDTANKINSSSVSFSKDTIMPIVNLISPANGTITTNTSVEINVSIVEENLDKVIWNWNNTNYTIMDDFLVLFMNFENLSALGENDTHVVDVSGNGNNGTVTNAIWNSSGKYGGAMQFDGNGDYVNITNIVPFNFERNDSFTFSVWFKSSGSSATQSLLGRYDNTVNWNGYALFIRVSAYGSCPANSIHFNLENNWNGNRIDVCTGAKADIYNVWHHVALTYNGSSKASGVKIYYDGTSQALTLYLDTLTQSTKNNLPLHIGDDSDSDWFNGSIDEVRIWNRSLSASEVNQMYMSNLQKYNQTQWYLYVNQTKNSTTGLDLGTYTYFASAKDTTGNENLTETRYVTIQAPDTTYPIFSDYWDNNATLTGSGTGLFNVTIENTNGTVLLEINNTNITATNLTANVYNASAEFTTNGTYAYRWHSWGNGTSHLYNVSETRYYTINASDINPPIISNARINASSSVGINSVVKVNASIVDSEGHLDSVKLEIIPPVSASYNTTPSQNGNEFYNSSIILNEAGHWQFKFYANDTFGNNATQLLAQDLLNNNYIDVQVYGNLSVVLISPTGTNSQPQNQSFVSRVNVTCVGEAGAVCGTVNGSIRYNASSDNPDTLLQGGNIFAAPFYTIEPNPQTCGELNVGDNPCNLSFIVNATGDIGESYKLDVNFTSDVSYTASNNTNFTIIRIVSPILSIILSDDLMNINFGSSLNPGTLDNPAVYNPENAYNLTCVHMGGNCNISIKGNSDLAYNINKIGIGNISWNWINNNDSQNPLSLTYNVINSSLANLATQFIYFWLDVPATQVAGDYQSNFTIYGESA